MTQISLQGTAPIIGGDEPLVHWILWTGVGFRSLLREEAGDIDATVGERLGGDRALVPDVVVLSWERIPIDADGEIANLIPLAPDWEIVILSPEPSHTRVTKNLLHCLKHGTTMGWLIDPAEKTVFVYRPKQEIEVFEEFEAVLPMPEWVEGVTVTVERLFRWLKF